MLFKQNDCRHIASLLICAVAILSFLRGSPVSAAAPTTQPDHFVISYWCGPPARFISDARVKEIKEANFNVAGFSCGGATVEHNRELLGHCQNNGIKAIIIDSRMVYGIGKIEQNRKQLE